MTLRLVQKSTNRLSTHSVDERRPRSTVTLPRIRARIFLSSRHVSLLLMKVGLGLGRRQGLGYVQDHAYRGGVLP